MAKWATNLSCVSAKKKNWTFGWKWKLVEATNQLLLLLLLLWLRCFFRRTPSNYSSNFREPGAWGQPHRVPNGVPATAGKNKAAKMGCNQVETRRNAGKMDRPVLAPKSHGWASSSQWPVGGILYTVYPMFKPVVCPPTFSSHPAPLKKTSHRIEFEPTNFPHPLILVMWRTSEDLHISGNIYNYVCIYIYIYIYIYYTYTYYIYTISNQIFRYLSDQDISETSAVVLSPSGPAWGSTFSTFGPSEVKCRATLVQGVFLLGWICSDFSSHMCIYLYIYI